MMKNHSKRCVGSVSNPKMRSQDLPPRPSQCRKRVQEFIAMPKKQNEGFCLLRPFPPMQNITASRTHQSPVKRASEDSVQLQLDSFTVDLTSLGGSPGPGGSASFTDLCSPLPFRSPSSACLTPILFSPSRKRGRYDSFLSQEDLTDLEEALSDTCSSDDSSSPGTRLLRLSPKPPVEQQLKDCQQVESNTAIDVHHAPKQQSELQHHSLSEDQFPPMLPPRTLPTLPIPAHDITTAPSLSRLLSESHVKSLGYQYLTEKIGKLQRRAQVAEFQLNVLTSFLSSPANPSPSYSMETNASASLSSSTSSASNELGGSAAAVVNNTSSYRVLEFVEAAMSMFQEHNKGLAGGPGSPTYVIEQTRFVDQALSLYLQQLSPASLLENVDNANELFAI